MGNGPEDSTKADGMVAQPPEVPATVGPQPVESSTVDAATVEAADRLAGDVPPASVGTTEVKFQEPGHETLTDNMIGAPPAFDANVAATEAAQMPKFEAPPAKPVGLTYDPTVDESTKRFPVRVINAQAPTPPPPEAA